MNFIPHILFHSVAPKKDPRWYRSFLTVELPFFEGLIQFLIKKDYTFIDFDEYYFHVNNKENRKLKAMCFSFDDGYLDNYVYVLPILKKYNIKATIFISPEFVQDNGKVRQTLEDVWENRCKMEDLETLGFVSWDELKIMQDSGVFDVQSHTLTHTRYFVSDKIVDFHHKGSDYLYPISNHYPDKKAYYMSDPQFKYLLPFGYPFFEEKSAVVARKVNINQQFIDDCIDLLKINENTCYSFNESMSKIERLYDSYKMKNTLIEEVESDNERNSRIKSEIIDSKKIIEDKLNKKVNHCCWPHGVYSEFCHQTALEAGYKTTAIFEDPKLKTRDPSLILRNGFDPVRESVFLSTLKVNYKINSLKGVFPYNLMGKMVNVYKNI